MRKGQVSTELLVIIAIVLLIFLPLLVLVYFKTGEANAQIGAYQGELAVFRLAYLADSVGSLGSNTSVATEVYVPPGVSELSTRSFSRGGEIVMKVRTPAGDSEIAEIVKFPIVNPQNFSTSPGWARFTITSVYVGGEASLRIESARD